MKQLKTVVIATGGFDPIHSGHIYYLNHASLLGDILLVGINSDEWLARKKGRFFMPWNERSIIIDHMQMVDEIISFDDSDNTAIDAIKKAKQKYPRCKIVFANGGDRTKENIPEMVFDDVEFVFGVGGENKANSSSWILKQWEKPKTQRNWGEYTVLDSNGEWKVKELSFDVGKSLSNQRHFNRSEHWHVVKGSILMEMEFGSKSKISRIYNAGESIDIPKKVWHKATNIGSEPAKVIEVWMGKKLTEDDIERK